MTSARDTADAASLRDLAEYDAIDALCRAPGGIDDLTASNSATPGGCRSRDRPGANSCSTVLSVRLDYDLLEALERRAALTQTPPSALARNLIRLGLSDRDGATARLVDELESVAMRLCAEVP